MKKVFFHLDMDTFFVSCERKMNPDLIDKPVAIANNFKRSIASSISYELKRIGLKSGDPVFKIKELCPSTIFVKPHYDLYNSTSKFIFNLIQEKFCQNLEIYSIDECFLDVTNILKNNEDPVAVAKKLQTLIWEEAKIPCSIGISFTKFLAKMSTNLIKPHGILMTQEKDIEKHFFNLPIGKIWGIGKKSSNKLNQSGIITYKDLVESKNTLVLRKILTKNYQLFVNQLTGKNVIDKIEPYSQAKGIGNSITFMEDDLTDARQLLNEMFRVAQNVALRLQNQNLEGKVIGLQIRNQFGDWNSKQKKIVEPINDAEMIFEICKKLFNELWDERPIRGIGIRVSSVSSIFERSEGFDLLSDIDTNSVKGIISQVNQAIGKKVVKTGKDFVKENQKKQDNIRFVREDFVEDKVAIMEEKWK
ncbi:DNA polymerase IV [Metamycoplasma subdolum]|uniref:Y-family DNA polymerase n=1 Tax=Metamycoplasma subdolum TaxID=92407 RepID=UPI00298D29CE|nr:DNA polymerase IV [Metamycoplasma subdolum]WPB50430.1 DNA polymerase IV [Metamycoplasma subdolum]